MGKYEHLIFKNLPQFEELEGRREKVPFWLTEQMFPDVKIRVAARDCSKMVNKPHAAPHSHELPEVYLAITEYPGDMKCEILLGDESYVVKSPFAVFIPARVRHAFKVLKCDKPNYMIGIILEYLKEK